MLLLALLLISCERERYLPFESVQPLLSLHAVAESGQPLTLRLERTGNLSSPDQRADAVDIASFEIVWNDDILQFASMRSEGDGLYRFENIVPREGDHIHIFISAEDLESVRAEIAMPEKLFTTLSHIEVDETSLNPRVQAQVALMPENGPGGYFLMFAEGTFQDPVTGELKEKRLKVSSSDSKTDERLIGQAGDPSDLLFVHLAPGRDPIYSMTITGIPANFSAQHPKQKLELVIQQITPDLYEYYVSVFLANQQALAQSPFSPVQIHTNVKGGLGVAGAAHTTPLALYW